MRVLLDECLPAGLRRDLPGHDVTTVQRMGWAGTANGELLSLVDQAGFEAFVTVDRGVAFQQRLRDRGFGVVALRAPSNDIAALRPPFRRCSPRCRPSSPGTSYTFQAPHYPGISSVRDVTQALRTALRHGTRLPPSPVGLRRGKHGSRAQGSGLKANSQQPTAHGLRATGYGLKAEDRNVGQLMYVPLMSRISDRY